MKIFGVVGWKNNGKTGLMERLVREITGRGFSVSTVKHAHHEFDVDHEGKDSHRHRMAGATEVLLSSRKRWALMHENRDEPEMELSNMLLRVGPVDLVLIEGYKRDTHAKIEAHRAEVGKSLLAANDSSVCAVASDVKLSGIEVPVFDLNDTAAVADFILQNVGLEKSKQAAPQLTAPMLEDDCFSLPQGVEWVPVDKALDQLREKMRTVVSDETIEIDDAVDRILAKDAVAKRANPPSANSAVDGYGFAASALVAGATPLPLLEGRSAAGGSFEGAVPEGSALRILTGAVLPAGVDTVVLQEDVNVDGKFVAFRGSIKPGANTRKAGEDVRVGDLLVKAGRRLGPQDIGLLAAAGVAAVSVYQRLRVGVLSTGDEIVPVGQSDAPDKTYDANRPMLLNVVRKWNYDAVDLGHVGDDGDELRAKIDAASGQVDAIFTSGGASAGDEDHLADVLTTNGSLATWRIAVKPGRPLALGVWNGTPIFGLPGNPVAAMLCALMFGRPALSVLAGGAWQTPLGFQVPAAFEKRKKPGRREFLRARINRSGHVETFQSEGSGRVSGLSWADGFVELADAAAYIRPGDLVRYIPYSSFGI